MSASATNQDGKPGNSATRAAVSGRQLTAAAPLWSQLTTMALSLGGLGVSLYLTIAHYTTSTALACPDTGVINCEKVTTSPQSVIYGIPVALLGLIFYLFMTAVNSPWAWRANWPAVRWIRLGSLIAGVTFVLYLIYTELFTLNAICLWCTSVHVITFLLFALVVSTAAVRSGTEPNLAARPSETSAAGIPQRPS